MSTQPSISNVLLLPLNQQIDSRYSKTRASILKEFARLYYASTSQSELGKMTEGELFQSMDDAWNFLQERKSARPKIQFVQRKLTKDKKRQTGTSIYILQDDMPFLVDSIRQCLNRVGVVVRNVHNSVQFVERDGSGKSNRGSLKKISSSKSETHKAEALSCINCAHIAESQIKEVESEIRETLKYVSSAVSDYQRMCNRARSIQNSLLSNAKLAPVTQDEMKESSEFISWLLDNHFTFLGYEEYRIRNLKQGKVMELQQDSLLGISKLKKDLKQRVNLKSLPSGTASLILKKQVCNFAKSSNLSRVHRAAYQDFILIKEFDSKGNVCIEHRFVGLYTSSVYYQTALDIPLVRKKVNAVLDQSGFAPNGHSIKDLLQVINVFPRDELFQISKDQLYTTALETTQIQETQTSKLFVRKDSYGKFFSCLVYLPRDNFNTKVRLQIQSFLEKELQARETEFATHLSESMLVRLHFILRVNDIQSVKFNLADLEERLVRLVKPWDDYFQDALLEVYPDGKAEQLHEKYREVYSAAYKESYSGKEGLKDIARIEQVIQQNRLGLDLDSCDSEVGAELSFKIFNKGQQLFLSDVAPILENLGLKIISEKAFHLKQEDDTVWLHDFSLFGLKSGSALSSELESNFEDAFEAIWEGRVDDDRFNELVVTAGLNWRDAALFRAYAAYLKQIQFGYSPEFVADTLSRHADLCRLLLSYFYLRFDPSLSENKRKELSKLRNQITQAIDAVTNLAEDGVLRACLNLVEATQRTNFFQKTDTGKQKDYFSFKFLPGEIEGIPLPRPAFEIFVYSRRMEGVHLRGGKVARGGLRWSDRHEDYRTEVLGLVKAQQVKNSVIVPVGAKGGFVVKEEAANRDQFMELGISCYKTFISGLLDITDNLSESRVIPPQDVVRHDEDDPYLVVAADKGTATFSDIANEIAISYGFWLGDGFASGGSNGYDHKQMGITAKGAWVSVQRHFRELGVNVQEQDFSVVGIGDMSGDVFGNGMLLSKHICLVAAFNHLHIFVDPNPDSAASFRERQRLFKKPRSTWADYSTNLISSGGGIFSRSDKSIRLTPEMKKRFAIEADSLTPDALINAILKSPVDLIWNGGIGTYVKASHESHAEVGDKANDVLRVNANDLTCKVIGEGGNLGLTQAARIEYGLNGGISVTDFVDNSAGVDCSDHEVNIKILLNELLASKQLGLKRRNTLLESMTDDVSDLVLDNNYAQVQSIGIAQTQAEARHREYADLIGFLENNAGLDRDLEFIPHEDRLDERSAKNQFLTRPELAVLTSYMKMYLKAELAQADYIDDDYLQPYLHSAFPDKIVRNYKNELQHHALRREIIATQLANKVVNILGPSFIYRMVDSTASSVAEVVRAAIIAMDIFQIEKPWSDIEALDYQLDAEVQGDMMSRIVRLVRRVTRWLLRNRRSSLGFAGDAEFFTGRVSQFKRMLPAKLPPDFRQMYDEKLAELRELNVPEELAIEVCRTDFLFPATSLAEVHQATNEKLSAVVDVYYSIGEQLQLNWLGKMINQLPVANYWQALARETYLDDLSWQQRALTCNIVNSQGEGTKPAKKVSEWSQQNQQLIERSSKMLKQLQLESNPDYPMFSVALRELLTLAQATALGDG